MSQAISFNGNSLQTFDGTHGIIVQQIDHSAPNKQANAYALAHANANAIPFTEYPSRPVTISGQISGSSIADCDSIIDTLQGYLRTQDANLDIGYNGGTRRYIGTATSIDIKRPGGLAYANFTIIFTCQPFGQDTTTTTALNGTSRTSQTYHDTVTFNGTAPYQLPIITITFSAVSDTTNPQTVAVGNDDTGQQIAVNRVWAATDVLVIDSTTNKVTVNGIEVEFSGAFPSFAPGSRNIGYSDTFATRTMTENVVYYPMYL